MQTIKLIRHYSGFAFAAVADGQIVAMMGTQPVELTRLSLDDLTRIRRRIGRCIDAIERRGDRYWRGPPDWLGHATCQDIDGWARHCALERRLYDMSLSVGEAYDTVVRTWLDAIPGPVPRDTPCPLPLAVYEPPTGEAAVIA
ncbi:MAG: hypothetical protein AB7H90_01300 [Alphaproteobacteria bacterium]